MRLNPRQSYPASVDTFEMQKREEWYGWRPFFHWYRDGEYLEIELFWWRYVVPNRKAWLDGEDSLQRRVLGCVPALYKIISTGS